MNHKYSKGKKPNQTSKKGVLSITVFLSTICYEVDKSDVIKSTNLLFYQFRMTNNFLYEVMKSFSSVLDESWVKIPK